MSVLLDQNIADTEGKVSFLPKTLYDQQFNQWPLHSTKIKLKAFKEVQIPACSQVCLSVVYKKQKKELPLIFADVDGPPTVRMKLVKRTQAELAKHLSR